MLVREQNDNGVSAQPAVAKKKNSGRSFSSHSQSVDFDSLAQHLSAYFRTDVQFTCNKKGKGRITIPFHSPEELERLIVMFDNMKK